VEGQARIKDDLKLFFKFLYKNQKNDTHGCKKCYKKFQNFKNISQKNLQNKNVCIEKAAKSRIQNARKERKTKQIHFLTKQNKKLGQIILILTISNQYLTNPKTKTNLALSMKG